MTTLAELFAADPRKYSKDGGEVAQIVKTFREAAANFNLGARSPGSAKAIAKTEKKATVSVEELKAMGLL